MIDHHFEELKRRIFFMLEQLKRETTNPQTIMAIQDLQRAIEELRYL